MSSATTTGRRCTSIGGNSARRSPTTRASRSTRRVMRSSSPSPARRAPSPPPRTPSAHSPAGRFACAMGLHTGEPRLTDEGYVGLDVHKGARIAAVGHGGQVLLSQATRALVDADVPRPGRAPPQGSQRAGAHLPARDRRPAGRVPAAEDARGGHEEPPPAANVVRRPGVGTRSDRPAAGGPRMPPAHARRTGRSGQDQARARGRRSPRRPLPARRPLRTARVRRVAGLPRARPRRVDPVRPRRRAQQPLGAGPAARLPQRALDAARARQLRASRRGLRASGRGDRARTAGRSS